MTEHKNCRELAEKYNGVKEAYCDACGGTYEFRRGDAIVCPYCSNAPETVILTGGVFYLDYRENARWYG